MNLKDCKEGVRVCWAKTPDTGTIISVNGSVLYFDNVWVKWDSDQKTLHIDHRKLALLNQFPDLTEEQAVLFLLSKGYIVSKSKE